MKAIPLKRLVDPARPITYGIVQAGEHVENGIPYIRPVDMIEHAGVPDAAVLLRTTPEIAQAYSRSALTAGDIVISIGPSFGKTMVVPDDLEGANLTQGTARVAPAEGVDARFLRWALRSKLASSYWEAAVGGATFRALNLDPLSRTPIPDFPREGQRAIADFLDAETSRLDALIAKKRRMIALLHDRVQAAIDGLTVPRAAGGTADAGASMWPMVKLRYCASFFTDGDWIETPFITTSGIRLVQTGNIGAGEFRDVGHRYISQETFRQLNCTLIHPGEVLISRLGDRVGGACLAPNIEEGMVASVDVAIMRPNSLLYPGFLVRFLSSSRHLQEAALLARGTTMSRIARSQLGSMQVPLPPMEEQIRIDRAIELEEGRCRRLERALRHQLLLLQEHRQALITAAVTGEIDVPGAT